MTNHSYPGIRFPDRAEAIDDFSGYKVFLDPWEPLAEELRRLWEALAVRSESSILAIYGQQGAGKTLLTKKLVEDFESTRLAPTGKPDENNIWHRITGRKEGKLDAKLVKNATSITTLSEIDNQDSWVDDAASVNKGQRDRACVLLADNAEGTYFLKGLVKMTGAEFLQHKDSAGLIKMSAQRLVAQMRGPLRGSLLVMLSNEDLFLLAFHEEIEKQHSGLMHLTQLRLPDAKTKETVIRVNTNRLNPVTYWSSIDRAEIDARVALKGALEGDSSFPDAFKAVDSASRNRIGRPAKRNAITLVVLANSAAAKDVGAEHLAVVKHTEVAHDWMSLHTFHEGWAKSEPDGRQATLLESEWILRVCVLGTPFVQSLLAAGSHPRAQDHFDAVKRLLETLGTHNGPGTHETTRKAYAAEFEQLIDNWPKSNNDLRPFWGAGQARAAQYEGALKEILPGYDSKVPGFLNYRPDYVVETFRPCAVTDAISNTNDAIRAATLRQGHVFEFTAQAQPSVAGIDTYLQSKLPNYVELTQEQ